MNKDLDFEKRSNGVSAIVRAISDIYLSNPILKHADESVLYNLIYDDLVEKGYNSRLIDEAWLRWCDENVG